MHTVATRCWTEENLGMTTHHRFETNRTFVVSSDGFLFNQILLCGGGIAVIGFVSITFTNLSERKRERRRSCLRIIACQVSFFLPIVQVEYLHRDLAHRQVWIFHSIHWSVGLVGRAVANDGKLSKHDEERRWYVCRGSLWHGRDLRNSSHSPSYTHRRHWLTRTGGQLTDIHRIDIRCLPKD